MTPLGQKGSAGADDTATPNVLTQMISLTNCVPKLKILFTAACFSARPSKLKLDQDLQSINFIPSQFFLPEDFNQMSIQNLMSRIKALNICHSLTHTNSVRFHRPVQLPCHDIEYYLLTIRCFGQCSLASKEGILSSKVN